jgi:hypothetical protein
MAHSLRRYYPDQVLRVSLSLLESKHPWRQCISNMETFSLHTL